MVCLHSASQVDSRECDSILFGHTQLTCHYSLPIYLVFSSISSYLIWECNKIRRLTDSQQIRDEEWGKMLNTMEEWRLTGRVAMTASLTSPPLKVLQEKLYWGGVILDWVQGFFFFFYASLHLVLDYLKFTSEMCYCDVCSWNYSLHYLTILYLNNNSITSLLCS